MARILFIFLGYLLVPVMLNAFQAAETEQENKTLSPYFYVNGSGNEAESIPLLSTSANVIISGVIADVRITQVYKNDGKNPIEAIYVFPGSTRAAVYGMTMRIADRLLIAEIQKREEARQTYEKAKSEGKAASLLEQERPNVFQMNVANIMPGDTISVELSYTELLIPENGIYEFVYPAVVGPRYSNKNSDSDASTDKFVETPYTKEGILPLYKFDINLVLNAGMTVDTIFSNSHKISTSYLNEEKTSQSIKLSKEESSGGNRDFILKYILSGGKIQTGLLLSKGTKENFFLLMLQPPKRVDDKTVVPREYIFVVDVSGSMHGFPLSVSKTLMKNLLGKLKGTDKFNILLFAGSSRFMSCESVEATEENISRAIELIDNQTGGGGTELLAALNRAMNVPKISGFSRSIVVITDGYIDVETETFELIRKNLNQANLFAFGIGSSVNRFLIEGMARAGLGSPFIVPKENDATDMANKFEKYIQSPVMTDIKVEYDGFLAYNTEPVSIPDVLAERPILIFGKWQGEPTGRINISGNTGNQRLQTSVNLLKFGTPDTSNALKYLWAREKISSLSDYLAIDNDSAKASEVTKLGLDYNLLTKYTSFVAVDYIIKNETKTIQTVKQPLPLPEGVSDYAVGRGFSGMPAVNYAPQSASGGAANALAPGSPPGRGKGTAGLKNKYSVTEESRIGTLDQDNRILKYPESDDKPDFDIPPVLDAEELKKNLNYPEKARLEGISGKAIVKALIDKTGKSIKQLIVSSDNKIFEIPAKASIQQCNFKPAVKSGKPVPVWLTIPVLFNIDDFEVTVNRLNEKLYQTSTGIGIEELKPGTGTPVGNNKTAVFHLKAYTDNCLVLQNTYSLGKPLSFSFDNQKARSYLYDILAGMKAGGKRTVQLTAKQASTFINVKDLQDLEKIIIEVELISVK